MGNVNRNFVLMGDFNYGFDRWPPLQIHGNSSDAANFYNCLEDNFLTQHVDIHTRPGAILDLVISDEPHIVKDMRDLGCLATSDHTALEWKLILDCGQKRSEAVGYDYAKADYEGMREELSKVNWKDLFDGNDIETNWCSFRDCLLHIQQKFTPIRKKSNKRKLPLWMTHKAAKAVKQRRKVYRKYGDSSHPACRRATKNAKKLLDDSRRHFENKLAANIDQDRKSFFAYANSKSKSRVRVGPLVDLSGQTVSDPGSMCEIMNNYFTTVFTREDVSCLPNPEQMYTGSQSGSLMDIVISEQVIADRLRSLKSDKSAGVDNLGPRLLKELGQEIAGPIADLFRQSILESTVPEDWKRANVTPIFKKGNRQQSGNYRPVSLTSIVCKVCESVIRDEIVAHLTKYSLISDTQHGFRKGRSCASNLLEFLEYVTTCLDNNESVDVLYLDLAKAFDKVPHVRLLQKLRAHGIDGAVFHWIQAWLSRRYQRVCIEGVSSQWILVVSGVPQGSVLGALLFLIFVNDMDTGILNRILKFADDTKLFGTANSRADQAGLQNDLDILSQWAYRWQMSFNVEKCKVMHLGHHNANSDYYMGGKLLQKTKVERDLGVVIADDGKVAGQCEEAYARASRMLGLVKRSLKYRHPKVMISLYKTLVRPHLEYSMVAWSPYYQKDKCLLERVQHRFTRLFPHLRDIPYEARLEKLGLWTLEERRNRGDLIEVFKMIKGLSDIRWQSFFTRSNASSTRGHSWKLAKQTCNRDCRLHFFSLRVINRWNSLSQELIESDSVNGFKSGLEKLRKRQMGFFKD